MKKVLKFITVCIFLWGIFLRAVEVVSGNFIFNFDAGRDLLAAQRIILDNKPTLIGAEIGSGSAGINGIFQGPGYYYLLAVVYKMFGGNPYGALVMMFAFGVVSLAAVYLTVRHMLGERVAIASFFLTAISPLIVSQSRFIWAPHPMSILLVLYFYFMYMVPKKPILYSFLALLCAGLTYHFELAMTVPMVLAVLIAMPGIYRIHNLRAYLWGFIALLFSFSPFLLFEIRHGFLALSSLFAYSTPDGPVGKDVWLLRILDHLGPYLANAYNSFPLEHGLLPEKAFMFLCIILLAYLIVLAIKEPHIQRRQLFQFMLLTLGVSYVVLLFLNNIVWDYYLIHAHYIFMYVFAYVWISSLMRFNFSNVSKMLFGVLCIFIFSMMVSSVWRMRSNYTYDLHDLGGFEKIKGKQAAIDYVYGDAKGQQFSVFVFTPPIYTFPYDYLFLNYGKKKYGYMPGNEKKGLVYLIIEPDPSKPWTYKGWLETVIVGGEIQETINYYTGHIIQKRIFSQ